MGKPQRRINLRDVQPQRTWLYDLLYLLSLFENDYDFGDESDNALPPLRRFLRLLAAAILAIAAFFALLWLFLTLTK